MYINTQLCIFFKEDSITSERKEEKKLKPGSVMLCVQLYCLETHKRHHHYVQRLSLFSGINLRDCTYIMWQSNKFYTIFVAIYYANHFKTDFQNMDHTLNCVQKLVGHCQLTSSSELLTDDDAWLWLSSHSVFPSSSFIATK